MRWPRPRLRLRGLLVLMALVAFALVIVAEALKPGRPRIFVVGQEPARFGPADRDRSGRFDWMIRNEGRGPLRLTLRGDFSLLLRRHSVSELEIAIEPGGFASIGQFWTRRDGSRPFPSSIHIETNDPDAPRVLLRSDGTALPFSVTNTPGRQRR